MEAFAKESAPTSQHTEQARNAIEVDLLSQSDNAACGAAARWLILGVAGGLSLLLTWTPHSRWPALLW